MSDLEKEIVGAFILNKRLFDEIDCPVNLFQGPHCKAIFKCLKAAHRNGRAIDTMILIEDLNKKIPATFITSLTDGYPKSLDTIDVVSEKVRRLKTERIGGQIIEEAGSRGEDILKGIPADVSKINKLIADYNEVRESKQLEIPLVSFSNIDEKATRWHVPYVYATGMIHALAGMQGHGKSLHLLDLSAKTSVGGTWPITGTQIPKGDVIYITDEDSPQAIMKPRLRLAGADMSRIFIPDFNAGDLILPENIPLLEKWIRSLPNTLFMAIDPIADSARGDLNQMDPARNIIAPLKKLADRTGVCIVYSLHLNKKTDLKDVQRVAHSYVLTSKPRLAWIITKKDASDDSDPDRLFLCGKTAFKPIPNMMFTIGEDENENPFIESWNQHRIQTVDALGTSDERRDLKIKEAENFFMRTLPDDGTPMQREELWILAKEQKIAEATFYRAARGLKNIKRDRGAWSLTSSRKSHREQGNPPDPESVSKESESQPPLIPPESTKTAKKAEFPQRVRND